MSNIQVVGEDDFDAVVEKAEGLVLVDFHAPWCGPCKAMAPALDTFAAQRADVKVIKVDVDDAFHLANRLGIRGVPTLSVYKDGKLVRSRTGAQSVAQLTELVG